jgi:phage major head subunit gpT-like protein
MKAYTPKRTPFTREVASDGAFEVYADMGAVPWPAQIGGQSGSGGTDGRTGLEQTGGLHAGEAITILGGNERGLIVYNQDWTVPIGVTHNAINDARVGGLENWARNAGERFQQHMDYLAFAALNGGDGTTYGKAYDKLSFFNDSHTDPGAEYTTTQDNAYALALTLDNFETVRVAAGGLLDDRGQPVGYDYNLLVCSLNLERVARNIVGNPQAYDTANRELNPYAGEVELVVAPGGWVDSTFWSIVAGGMSRKPINLQIRQQPELVFWDDESQGSGVRYYKWAARYAVFYGDWRLALMGNT